MVDVRDPATECRMMDMLGQTCVFDHSPICVFLLCYKDRHMGLPLSLKPIILILHVFSVYKIACTNIQKYLDIVPIKGTINSITWNVIYGRKALKQQQKLPVAVRNALVALVIEIRSLGPVRGNWKNYSKLAEKRHHCHIKSGRPTYVAV